MARATGATTTVGLDESAGFAAAAEDALRADAGTETGAPRIRFAVHDATVVPFPTGPADVVYARYLLCHLPEPDAVVRRWRTQLRPGGRLLVDEVGAIDTDQATFAEYLEVTSAMIAGHGGDLLLGRRLSELAGPDLEVVHDRVATISPTTAEVATMFAMNLQTWRADPWVGAHVAADVVRRIERGLEGLRSSTASGEIVWHQRQVAFAVAPTAPGRGRPG